MSVHLSYSYCRGFSKNEEIAIDTQVFKNRRKIYTFVKNLPLNTKRGFFVSGLGVAIWFSNVRPSKAIGLSMPPMLPPAPMVRVEPKRSYEENRFKLKSPRRIALINNGIVYNSNRSEILLLIYSTDPRISSNQQLLKITKKLRGGSLTLVQRAVLILIAACIIAISEGFVIPQNWGWGLDVPQTTRLESSRPNRPPTMPHPEFVGLTKEARRYLANEKDMKIQHEGYPELTVNFWQAQFKVESHGMIHDLPFTLKNNGVKKTEKSDENVLKMMQSIVNMPNRDGVELIENGMYQGGTERGFEAIHIYDFANRIIAVFKKSTGSFVTTCQLSDEEHAELKATNNFRSEKSVRGQVMKLPPQQDIESEFTRVSNFLSDVMEMCANSTNLFGEDSSYEDSSYEDSSYEDSSYEDSSYEDSSAILGFTPINTFESDVMGITPADTSQFDNP